MIVKIELLSGPNKGEPTRIDMDRNIEALQRVVNGKRTVADDMLVLDTISILEGIKEQLPDPRNTIGRRYR